MAKNTQVKIEDHTEEVKNAMKNGVDLALEKIGMAAEGFAKLACPVDTGRLRSSITHEKIGKDTEAVGTNVEYAPYVELGHHQKPGRFVPAIGKRLKADYVKGKPFLKPAINDHLDLYKNIIEQQMKQ